MKQRIISILALLCLTVVSAWADGYYVVGTMTGWKVNSQYKLYVNPSNTNEMMTPMYFQAGAEFKVVYSEDGVSDNAWYPGDGTPNYYVTNEGRYTVYFRSDYGGGSDWHYNCIYLASTPDAVTPTANKNEWTFQMPAYDVVVGVEYETALALNEVEVSQTAVPTETAYVDFIPTLGKTTITGDDATSVLFLAAENKLKNPTTLPTDMKGFRAYFQLKDVSTARSFQLNLGEEATGVQFVATESQQTGQETYDLQGRRMESSIFNTQSSKLKKGVYIVNGKKTVVR